MPIGKNDFRNTTQTGLCNTTYTKLAGRIPVTHYTLISFFTFVFLSYIYINEKTRFERKEPKV